MPERDDFPAEYFEGNPFEGLDPSEVYRELQWGNASRRRYAINAPEPLASLGWLAKIDLEDGRCIMFADTDAAPFVAVGTGSNLLYIIPRKNGRPVDVPEGPYECIGAVTRTEYYSDKGRTKGHYYHDHDAPFPDLCEHPESGVCVLRPAVLDDGRRSYAVGPEGVIG